MPALDHLLTTLQLRVDVASRAQLHAGWSVGEHELPCNKIYFPYKGAGGYTLDGVRHELAPGQVALLPIHHANACWHDPEQPYEKIWIHFEARVMGLVDLFEVIPCPPPLDCRGDEDLRRMLEAMVAEYRAPTPYQTLALNGLLAQALARILRKAEAQPAARAAGKGAAKAAAPGDVVLRGPGDRIGSVLQHIAANFAKDLTLEDLAEVVHLHPTYFSNTFRKATGMAPMAFVQRFRVERAKGMLASTDLPVMDVAAKVGFADPYHFSRVFKKMTGTSPSAYQDSVRKTTGRA
ncbi:MAG: helix-turn-helix transcriptional regulator [Planctomycetota bacterium]|nr:helix-turn-helix transcriptional regulator [Planctomycetota bacterium]